MSLSLGLPVFLKRSPASAQKKRHLTSRSHQTKADLIVESGICQITLDSRFSGFSLSVQSSSSERKKVQRNRSVDLTYVKSTDDSRCTLRCIATAVASQWTNYSGKVQLELSTYLTRLFLDEDCLGLRRTTIVRFKSNSITKDRLGHILTEPIIDPGILTVGVATRAKTTSQTTSRLPRLAPEQRL